MSLKVDREERPDIDNYFMNAAMMMTGSSGGRPLNVMLTPDLKPFFATTCIPKESREVVIVGEAEAEDTQGMLAGLRG